MRKQTNSKKLKTLNSLSTAHHYAVNDVWIHFFPCPLADSADLRMDYYILTKDIISTFYSDDYLYIYCKKYRLYLLQLKTESLFVWMPNEVIQQKIKAHRMLWNILRAY